MEVAIKNNKYLYLLMIFTMAISCIRKDPKNWDEKELLKWFNGSKWTQGWNILHDESINQKEFSIQFHRNPHRWEKAFNFLKDSDLSTLATGRYELEGPDLFVNIEEYVTKDEENTRYEAHRKYADIQYLINGEEYIGIAHLRNTTNTVPYDEAKDVAFMTADEDHLRYANPDKFFVFFPEDAHRPGIKASTNMKVKKQ
jgi:YhcH/YjgK/YiaL family protein